MKASLMALQERGCSRVEGIMVGLCVGLVREGGAHREYRSDGLQGAYGHCGASGSKVRAGHVVPSVGGTSEILAPYPLRGRGVPLEENGGGPRPAATRPVGRRQPRVRVPRATPRAGLRGPLPSECYATHGASLPATVQAGSAGSTIVEDPGRMGGAARGAPLPSTPELRPAPWKVPANRSLPVLRHAVLGARKSKTLLHNNYFVSL
ncbi:uncharacterized protein A4U43_C04F2330 [Asparagus officinalis]|uniref:Uncharacterized protein n=1 Tax=Asparagus officinalis TaxID=4686 RepID=A0A5P1EXR2_ASPOF|nr:uncharacterized protein A4U43_C04F2330 [Asparagus officinalis]